MLDKIMPYYRDTWVEIQLDHLDHNIRSMSERLPVETAIFAVVKANAYGHGYGQIAKEALHAGASALCVAFLDEGIHLRKKGIEAPILVLGASRPEDAKLAAEYNISLTVFQEEWLDEAMNFIGHGTRLKVHVKCDTGMGRIGIRDLTELKGIEKKLENNNCFMFEGLFTHFATADELDQSLFKVQLSKFNHLVQSLETKPVYIHCANSAAAMLHNQTNFNAIRFGIAMYGLSPSPEIKPYLPFELKEVFSLHTKIINVKKVHAGDTVSYGATYKAEKEEWIATIPIGYADGWIRKLQGQEVLVNGARAQIVGRVCMDQCMIRLPEYSPIGTTVTLIGSQGNENISIDDIAVKLETINYEIPCLISTRVPRVYIRDNDIVEIYNPILETF